MRVGRRSARTGGDRARSGLRRQPGHATVCEKPSHGSPALAGERIRQEWNTERSAQAASRSSGPTTRRRTAPASATTSTWMTWRRPMPWRWSKRNPTRLPADDLIALDEALFQPLVGRGSAFTDLDGDGFPDV